MRTILALLALCFLASCGEPTPTADATVDTRTDASVDTSPPDTNGVDSTPMDVTPQD